MTNKNLISLCVVLCVGLVLLGAVYVTAHRMIMSPAISASVRLPTILPRPSVSQVTDLRATNTPSHPATTSSTSASSSPDCLEFDSLEEAARNPVDVCDLNLENNNLTEVPREVQQMTNLVLLLLPHNHIAALPNWIGDLKNLEVLDVSDNDLSELPNEIGGLVNLSSLSANYNQLLLLPDSIERMSKLQSLKLSVNRLAELPPLATMTSLEELAVNDNNLTTLPPDVSGLSDLKYLYLEGNQLAHVPPLNRLSLQALRLAGNPVCGSDGQIDVQDRANVPISATSFAALICIPSVGDQ